MIKRIALPFLALMLVAAGDPKTTTEWVVERGQTLRGIANQTGVPASILAAANAIPEPYDVRVGQKLVIPRQKTHVVKEGETGLGIAKRYGVPFSQIAIANSLPASGTVRLGQKLIIPAVLPERAAEPVATPNQPHFARPVDGKALLGWTRQASGRGHEGIDYAVATPAMTSVRASGSGWSATPARPAATSSISNCGATTAPSIPSQICPNGNSRQAKAQNTAPITR